MISGILHRYREGLRWRAIPAEYGPRTTLFNRFDRWSEKVIWQAMLAALVASAEPPDFAMVDSSVDRAPRSAADWRAIATRYDKTARNFLAGICLAVAVISWLQ